MATIFFSRGETTRRVAVAWREGGGYEVSFVDPPLECSELAVAREDAVVGVIREYLIRLGETKSQQPANVVVRYVNLRMLSTVDMNALLAILLEELGAPMVLTFEEMGDDERREATEVVAGIEAARERFRLYLQQGAGQLERRIDLEERIVREGRK